MDYLIAVRSVMNKKALAEKFKVDVESIYTEAEIEKEFRPKPDQVII